MVRVITGFNVVNVAEGQRLGFMYTEMNDNGKIVSDNNKGSVIVMDEAAREHITWLKEYINSWIESQK